MKHLLRQAFNFAAAVSAVLFVATCVLWVRSRFGPIRVSGTVKHTMNSAGVS